MKKIIAALIAFLLSFSPVSAERIAISSLPSGSTVQATDSIPATRSGTTYKVNVGSNLACVAGLTSAADKVPYFTGSGTCDVGTFTSFGRSLVDDADATAGKTTLGLVIGTNVQAYDADLAALAGLTSAADKLPYWTGSGTASNADLTSFGRSLIDDANSAAGLVTLGVLDFKTLSVSGQSDIVSDAAADTLTLVAGTSVTMTTNATTDTLTINAPVTQCFTIALTPPDQVNPASATNNIDSFPMPFAFTLNAMDVTPPGVEISNRTAPTGAALLTVDINEAGTSVISTKLTIDASETDSTTAAAQAVISDGSLAANAIISFDVDQRDQSGTGTGLKARICGHQ